MTKAIDQNRTPNSAALEYIADLIENGDDRYGFSSAFDLGAPHPAEGAAPEWFDDENFIRIYDELPAQADSTFHEQLEKCAQEPQNDTGNGQRLLKHFGADLLHVRDVGWHAWADTHWRREGGLEIATRCAQMTAARILLEADVMAATPIEQRMIDAGAEAREALAALDKIKDQSDEQRSKRKQLLTTIETGDAAAGLLKVRQMARRKYSVSSGNAGKIKGMIDQALPHRTVTVDNLDAEKLALNVMNGTLRFVYEEVLDPDAPDHSTKTIKQYRVELKSHDRADYITKVAPVEYDPAAKCPTFDASLNRFQPIAAVRAFLQRYHGYALTGETGEQCLIFNYGNGSNWKSTFIEIVSRIMGPYAQTIPFESLSGDVQKSGSQASPEFARLPGARLVRASEPDRGVQFREGLIKSLTGGEPMLTRANFKDFFEFRPDFKLVLSGNHKPEISGVDHGIWRRMYLVPWPVKIAKSEKRAMSEVMAELWPERSGMLNWLIAGTLDYLNGGLQAPQEVIDATAAYQEEMDPVGAFVSMCVVSVLPGPDGRVETVSARAMFDAFVSWADVNAVRPWKEKSFATAMTEKGFTKEKHRDGMRYLNVKLKNVQEAPRRRRDDEPPHPANSDIVPL